MKYKDPLEFIHRANLYKISKIDASVIWLHGLGADGHDFAPIVEQLDLPNVRFILPHAPLMPVTINSGYTMPAWYDLYGLSVDSREDEAGIQTSQKYINSLIELEIKKGTPAHRIVVAGFSQGGAIALHTALRYPQKLAGVIALSTYLPLKSKLNEIDSANARIPIFMAHGVYDDVISFATCQISLNLLQSRQIPITWHQYNMAHSVCAEEIDDIKHFLKQVLQ